MKLSRKMQRQIEIKIQHAMATDHTRTGTVVIEKRGDKSREPAVSK